ncbi:unnamed protein product [Caretta caretta]
MTMISNNTQVAPRIRNVTAAGPVQAWSGEARRDPTLSCSVFDETVDSGSGWNWIRQPAGKGLEWMRDVYQDDNNDEWETAYAPSLQGRVTISADPAKNRVSLQLRPLTAGDPAACYCPIGHTVTKSKARTLTRKGSGF